MNKRTFLKACTLLGASAPWFSYAKTQTAESLASDEGFWEGIRAGYKLSPDFINLESGYYNIIPNPTLNHMIAHARMVNYEGSYYMRTVQWDNKKSMVSKLARVVGTSDKNLIITRNIGIL